MRFLFVILVVFVLLTSSATAASLPENEPTGCLVYAKPLRDGPVRLLVIAPRYTLHDVSELERRLDVGVPHGDVLSRAPTCAQPYCPRPPTSFSFIIGRV